MNFIAGALIIAALTQVSCQVFKLFYYSIRDRAFRLKYLVTAGGFPSAHSAFVSSLAVAVGMSAGFNSDVFAVAAVLALIVMYDAYRLRGAVQRHAQLLNRLTERHFPEEHQQLNEMLGHSLGEIGAGIVFGSVVSVALSLLARGLGAA